MAQDRLGGLAVLSIQTEEASNIDYNHLISRVCSKEIEEGGFCVCSIIIVIESYLKLYLSGGTLLKSWKMEKCILQCICNMVLSLVLCVQVMEI